MCGNADLELVLRPCVGDDLPVVHTIEEGPVRSDRPEIVVGFEEEGVAVVCTESDLLRAGFRVPGELIGRLWVEVLNLVLDSR